MSNVELYLKLIWFIMSLIWLYFQNKKGLSTRGYSEFLAYLVTYYLSKVTEIKTKYIFWVWIYRDGILLVFKGRKSILGIQILRETSQDKVNEISGKFYLQFNCEAWNPYGRPSWN